MWHHKTYTGKVARHYAWEFYVTWPRWIGWMLRHIRRIWIWNGQIKFSIYTNNISLARETYGFSAVWVLSWRSKEQREVAVNLVQ